jgi:hypothetical protein
MKITIDTKEDSHEELRKVIKMLSSLVGEQEIMSNRGDLFGDDSPRGDSNQQSHDIFGDDTPSSSSESTDDSSSSGDSGNGMFNMFSGGSGDDTSSGSTTEETEDKKEKKDDDIGIDIPEVEEYE